MFSDNGSEKIKQNKKEEKPFKCTGCETQLGKYDETCPNCERKNPKYLVGWFCHWETIYMLLKLICL